jgi:AraC-like DNA-binding protein
MLQLDTAERAIEAFERLHGLNVTVHDLAGNLAPFLKPYRLYHRSPHCLAVKARSGVAACLQFEQQQVRKAVADLPDGRVHICHANLVEWVVPVFEDDKLAWVIFAGPRSPTRQLASAVRDAASPPRSPSPSARQPAPSPVQEDEAQMVLEHLRQLAARLEKWMTSAVRTRLVKPGGSAGGKNDRMTRRQITIRRFIEEGYAEPLTLPQLAQRLGLSESRASHLVQQSCGLSFRELLIQQRLRAAMDLLRLSDLSVLDIAVATGFETLAHFYRLFRRRIGTTPRQYRQGHA